jgi:two-component system, cell cycle sensor histidine kinase and response regulator CckA
MLESYGYRVLEAPGAQEAIETVQGYEQPIYLLLTDVVMPSMSGPDLASRIQTLRPGVKVLYMSGYTDETVFRHGDLEQGRLFLQKPLTPAALARKLREALRM